MIETDYASNIEHRSSIQEAKGHKLIVCLSISVLVSISHEYQMYRQSWLAIQFRIQDFELRLAKVTHTCTIYRGFRAEFTGYKVLPPYTYMECVFTCV